jgi:hypothetical protein
VTEAVVCRLRSAATAVRPEFGGSTGRIDVWREVSFELVPRLLVRLNELRKARASVLAWEGVFFSKKDEGEGRLVPGALTIGPPGGYGLDVFCGVAGV